MVTALPTGPRRLAGVVLALGLLLAGCGIPDDGQARGLPRKDVPFDLLASEPVSTTTTTAPSVPVEVTVYLVEAGHLVPVTRRVQSPATAEKVLRTLVQGPTSAEGKRGLTTSISRSTTILSANVADGGIAVIDVTNSFHVGSQPDTILAAAQMVFTATGLEGVRGVRFTLEGQRANIYQGDGQQTPFPVSRLTYASLAPLSGG
jgi:spore germination protein GerM